MNGNLRMDRWHRVVALAAVVVSTMGFAQVAKAQPSYADTQLTMPPDVLLLLDTSASMGKTSVSDAGGDYLAPNCGAYPASNPISYDSSATFDSGPSPADKLAWVIKALTGTVIGAGCTVQDRASTEFEDEFRIYQPNQGWVVSYDKNYEQPYHRIVASAGGISCTPAPSWNSDLREALAMEPLGWGVYSPSGSTTQSPIYWREVGPSYSAEKSCPFSPQQPDGLIDRLGSGVRFGLMTMDSSSDERTGVMSGRYINNLQVDYPGGMGGLWSYYNEWYSGSGGVSAPVFFSDGSPSTWGPFEVGARNPAALPWEGRLIGFGDVYAPSSQVISNNERVQQAILTLRPFGGRPTAALLSDAYYFLTGDNDYVWYYDQQMGYVGGLVDSNVWNQDRSRRGCRKRYAVLITDGVDNMDLRPQCQRFFSPVGGSGGSQYYDVCPYPTAQQTVQQMYDRNVDVLVVGLGVNAIVDGQRIACSDVMDPSHSNYRSCDSLSPCTDSDCGSGATCEQGYCVANAMDKLVVTCCTLDSMGRAGSGGERGAYFVNGAGELQAALLSELSVVQSGALSRTQPVYASGQLGVGRMGEIAGAQFYSSFEPQEGDLSKGYLVRERYVCDADGGGAKTESISSERGDNFHENVNGALDQRRVFTVNAEPTDGRIRSFGSVRPNCMQGQCLDGLSQISATRVGGAASGFAEQVAPDAMFGEWLHRGVRLDDICSMYYGNQVTSGKQRTAPYEPTESPQLTAEECRTRYIRFELGYGDSAGWTTYQRASSFGAVGSATPLIVMPPNERLRDGSYDVFQTVFARRPPMLYAATVDGQVHGFEINRLDNSLNELWSFVPPAMLPLIAMQFYEPEYAGDIRMLNGQLSVGEVAGTAAAANASVAGKFLTRYRAGGAQNDVTQWYTVMVGSFNAVEQAGEAPSGFYALDVTNPSLRVELEPPFPGAHYTQGPRMLWQLTSDAEGLPLFGTAPGRAAITTLYYKAPGEEVPAQHAVAIVPGGDGGIVGGYSQMVKSQKRSAPGEASTSRVIFGVVPRTEFEPYGPVPSWPEKAGLRSLAGARSITIVRLDTGEVVRTFRRPNADGLAVYDESDPQGPKELYDNNRVTAVPFPAPITGQVAVYPQGAGVVSDRAYVGDGAGLLWRMDLTSTDPAKWQVDMIHDTFPDEGPGAFTPMYPRSTSGPPMQERTIGPIQTPPIISTDPSGNVTIAVATGDQENLYMGQYNSVWSLTETRADDGRIKMVVNWFLNSSNAGVGGSIEPSGSVPMTLPGRGHFAVLDNGTASGERVTGPMALFASQLYFTTYNPATSDAESCSVGNSYLWGVHYTNAGSTAQTPSQDPSDGPLPQLLDDSTEPPTLVRVLPFDEIGIAYGVGLMQTPSCSYTEVMDDPVLGLGMHRSLSGMVPGGFELRAQLGMNRGTNGRKVGLQTTLLDIPFAGASIDSWASILN